MLTQESARIRSNNEGAPGALDRHSYDKAILHPSLRALYGGSGYYNLGYWQDADGKSITSLPRACERLVDCHLTADTRPHAAIATVVDVGCGLGATTARIAARYAGALVVGVNYSPAQLAHAQQTTGPQLRFVTMDATHLALAANSVDTIHSIEAAIHFSPRTQFFREAARVMVPGGRMVLTDIIASRANTVVPRQNIVPDLKSYLNVCETSGLRPLLAEDITDKTVAPFTSHMRSRGLANIARFFEGFVDQYILVVLEKPMCSTSR